MRRTTLALTAALLVPAAALPAAALGRGVPRGPAYGAPDAPIVRVLKGVAAAQATADGVDVVLASRGWKGPWGTPTRIAFGPSTRFAGKAGMAADIAGGDRVQVVVLTPRRPKGPLPAAELVVDLGPARATGPFAPWLGRPAWFVLGGRVTATTGDSLQVRARVANRTARKALRRAGTRLVTVRVDPATTRIRKRGEGRVTLSRVAVGDRVWVTWRAPRWTPLADLPAARRILVR